MEVVQPNARKISIVIPTYNMAPYLQQLWNGLKASHTLENVAEIIFVNDGSTDDTERILCEIKNAVHDGACTISVLSFSENKGRFLARKEGAVRATGQTILFLDTRVCPSSTFGTDLVRVAEEHDAVLGQVIIDTEQSIYSLYWERVHENIFARHYQDIKEGFYLTKENYDLYAKGTGIFLCRRDIFLDACNKFETNLLSDDTYLMYKIVKKCPIFVSSSLSVHWTPREQLFPFLWRLWDRGPGFVEYHVMQRRGTFFWVTIIGLVVIGILLATLVINPKWAFFLVGLMLLATALSTVLIAKSFGEFLRMFPLNIASIIAFGLGVLRGLFVNLSRPRSSYSVD